jgi:hypothetical protein
MLLQSVAFLLSFRVLCHFYCYSECCCAKSCIFNYYAQCECTDSCYAERRIFVVILSALMHSVVFLLLFWVLKCRVSHFYSYSECCYAECRFCCYTERHYSGSCIFNYFADCQYTDHCYAECRFFIVILSAIKSCISNYCA